MTVTDVVIDNGRTTLIIIVAADVEQCLILLL